MHASRCCCFLVLLPVCSAIRHTSCSAVRHAPAFENEEVRGDEPAVRRNEPRASNKWTVAYPNGVNVYAEPSEDAALAIKKKLDHAEVFYAEKIEKKQLPEKFKRKQLSENVAWLKLAGSEGYVRLASDAQALRRFAEVDKPEDYIIISEDTLVTEGRFTKSAKIEKLQAGTRVTVTKVRFVQKEACVRGQIGEAAWINLVNIEDGFRWAKKALSRWKVTDQVNVFETAEPGAIIAHIYPGPSHRPQIIEVDVEQVVNDDGPSHSVWLKLAKHPGWVRFADDDQYIRPILEAPSLEPQTAMINWNNTQIVEDYFAVESTWTEQRPALPSTGGDEYHALLPECETVYTALLANGISVDQAAWNKPLVDNDKLFEFLSAINQRTNPLFVGASRLESTKWYVSKWSALPNRGHITPELVEIVFPDPQNVMVVGDLHGRLGSLRRAHRKWIAEGRPYVVVLGDMVDRGNRQVEVVAAILAWRCQFPDKVMVLHGNHESKEVNYFYGLKCADRLKPFREMRTTHRVSLFDLLNSIFDKIPTALVIKQPPGYEAASGVFIHGSFGEKAFKASMYAPHADSEVCETVLSEMMWSEKGDHHCQFSNDTTWYTSSPRGPGLTDFCPLIGFHFMKNLGVCNLFTGHSHTNGVLSESRPQQVYNGVMEDPIRIHEL